MELTDNDIRLLLEELPKIKDNKKIQKLLENLRWSCCLKNLCQNCGKYNCKKHDLK